MGVGTNDSGLESKGSYIFVFERIGSDGTSELVARRMRHTPNLPVHMVFSEGAEVYSHDHQFVFTKQGRGMTTSTGKRVPLYMGAHTKLGWLKVKPVLEQARARDIYRGLGKQQGGHVMALGDGQPRSSGMPKDSLRGVALLRRKHVVNGHCSLCKLLSILKAEGAAALVTKDDLREYASKLCGACESAKQKRRAFTIQTLADHTKAPIGKKWIWDACKLRVPSAQHGYVAIFLAVCDTSNKHFVCGLLGETAEDYKRAHSQLASFNRPHHGDIHVVRGDSHPSHAAREFRDYCSDTHKQLQLGPPYVHEASAAKSEVAFLVGVPTAVALLLAAVDLGDGHQYTAFNTAIAAWDYAASDSTADGVITSANMRYYGKTEWIANPLFVYGASVKALIHPEARGDHWELHAKPGVYTGPALNSVSPIHCSVWCDRYHDIDVGCMNIDERAVLARLDKAHHSHQPYNQVKPAADIAPDASTWFDAHTKLHPADVKLTAGDDLHDQLPSYSPPVWTSTLAAPISEFSLGVCSGVVRDGDLASWLRMLTSGVHHHVRLDVKVGGYEHMLERPHVLAALVTLAALPLNRCTFLQLPCGAWSKVKFEADGGPKPIFTVSHPDGVCGANGQPLPQVTAALGRVAAGVSIARATLRAGNQLISEHPAEEGSTSILKARDLPEHSGMHSTSHFVKLIKEFGLLTVLTDLACSGHAHRKVTEYLVSPLLYPAFQRTFGVLRVPHGWKSAAEPLRGKDGDGEYRTKLEEVYTPLHCQRLAQCILSVPVRSQLADVEGGDGVANTEIAASSAAAVHAPAPVAQANGATDMPATHTICATDALHATAQAVTDAHATEQATLSGATDTVAGNRMTMHD